VTDQNGGTVAGAKVILLSAVGTQVMKETLPDGSVVFPLVTPGAYNVTVEAASFRRAVLSGVSVTVTDVTNLNVKLEIGAVATEVMVSADSAETVNTTNATMGNVLTGDVLHNLPLGTRNFTFLLALNAGTSAPLPDATQDSVARFTGRVPRSDQPLRCFAGKDFRWEHQCVDARRYK
jgi:hypothetical protein